MRLSRQPHCPDTLNNHTTDVYPLNPSMENYFLPNLLSILLPVLSPAFTYSHLYAPIFICHNFFYLNALVLIFIYDHLRKSFLVYDHLWESIRTFSHLWESILIHDQNLLEHLFAFLNLCENKQRYEHHNLKQIFYH